MYIGSIIFVIVSKFQKRIKSVNLTFALCLTFVLSSCGLQTAVEDNDTKERIGFKGDFYSYEFVWQYGRNREWEEDVIFMVSEFLETHPLLSDRLAHVVELSSNDNPETIHVFSERSFYNSKIRDDFIYMANNLITQIPNLSDFEIAVGLSRIIAILDDSHSHINITVQRGIERLPILLTNHFESHFDPLYLDASQIKCWPHIRTAYVGLGDILNTRLIAVNGIDIEEIYRRIRPLFSHERGVENSFRLRSGGSSIVFRQILQYVDVIRDEYIIPLTVIDINDNVFTVYSPFVSSLEEVDLIAHQIDFTTFFWASRSNENYWFKHLPDENIMYFRYWSSQEMPNRPSLQFSEDLRNEIIQLGGVNAFVFDARANSGGYLTNGVEELILWAMDEFNRSLLGYIYVIVDQWSYSMGAVVALIWQKFVEDVKIVGSPTSGSLNFFATTIRAGNLPNSQLTFGISTGFAENAPNVEANSAVIPDVIVVRTLEDYINHHDAVIETIMQRLNLEN